MVSSDIIAVLQWWLVIFIIGTGFLPVALLIFSRFFDKGYIFAKTLGIAITSYAVFLFGILHVLPFNQINSAIIFLLVISVFYYFLRVKWRVIYLLKQHFRIFLFEEILFLAALFAWGYIHSFSPDIHGLEKYMDFGFINSILRSDFFPPIDMWFPPYYINYYYYGHFITAFLTKLSGVAPALSFNIMLSTIFALCFTQTFSIGANLFTFARKKLPGALFKFRRVSAGLLTAVLTTFAGNLHIIYSFFVPYPNDNPKPPWQLLFSPLTFPNSYWYPNATRYIYHTIHEFPIYSWVVADLHGHVLDIPFVLLIIALLLAIFVKSDPESAEEITTPPSFILVGFLLAIMYMTNAWDGAIYFLLASLITFYLLWERTSDQKIKVNAGVQKAKKIKSEFPRLNRGLIGSKFKIPESFWLFVKRSLVPIAIIAFSFLIFSFPYNYYFKPFASGIGILCAPDFLTNAPNSRIGPFLFEKDHCQHSHWWELLILYGFFYFFVSVFLIFLARAKKILRIDAFVLVLILLSTFLIFLPEFIYVKDIYPAHYRANTMFKLVFQAFIMLSICSAYIFTRIMQSTLGRLRFIFFPISLILIILVLIYPYLAVGSYYGDLKNYKGLDGIAYLKILYPDDYEAISWLNKVVSGQPVILEAQGDSYTDYARVSSNTGLPTVLGWTVHEWLWRGDYGIPAPRIAEVKDLYETKDLAKAQKLLEKYKVKYVFIGALEYQKYPALDEQKFGKLGKLVFQKDKTKIYQIK